METVLHPLFCHCERSNDKFGNEEMSAILAKRSKLSYLLGHLIHDGSKAVAF
jgi:hypothetical protein